MIHVPIEIAVSKALLVDLMRAMMQILTNAKMVSRNVQMLPDSVKRLSRGCSRRDESLLLSMVMLNVVDDGRWNCCMQCCRGGWSSFTVLIHLRAAVSVVVTLWFSDACNTLPCAIYYPLTPPPLPVYCSFPVRTFELVNHSTELLCYTGISCLRWIMNHGFETKKTFTNYNLIERLILP